MVTTYHAEKLWYLQKDTWLFSGLLIAIVMIGFLYRISKFRSKPSKKIITETHIIKEPIEKQADT